MKEMIAPLILIVNLCIKVYGLKWETGLRNYTSKDY